MASNGVVHVRLDENDKDAAAAVLSEMGLSVSGVVRAMLRRIAVEKAVPFDLRVPNADTRDAMDEADRVIRDRNARFGTAGGLIDELEKAGK